MMQHMMDVGMMWDMGLGGVRVMSVSPLKADIHKRGLRVRLVPLADIHHDRPYTGTMAPRVTLFSGEARNKIVAATSSTLGQAL